MLPIQTELYRQYGPQLNKIASDIDRQNAMAGAQTDADLANGVGGQNVLAADRLQRTLDPEFYQNRAQIGAGQSALLSSVDPTRMTGGELENVARGLGRSGQSLIPGNAGALNSAFNFGNALSAKQDRYSQYLAQASAGLNSLRSGMSGFGIATNKPIGQNAGQGIFGNGFQQGAGQQAYQTGNNLMSGVFGNQQRQYESALDKSGKVIGMAGKGIGAIAGGVMGGI